MIGYKIANPSRAVAICFNDRIAMAWMEEFASAVESGSADLNAVLAREEASSKILDVLIELESSRAQQDEGMLSCYPVFIYLMIALKCDTDHSSLPPFSRLPLIHAGPERHREAFVSSGA